MHQSVKEQQPAACGDREARNQDTSPEPSRIIVNPIDDHASPFTKAAAGACSSRILDRSAESMFDRMLKVNDCDFNF